jgi:WbqC-like protein family
MVSPFLTFPDITWWMQAAVADVVILDAAEHFQKMTGRNRYRIAGANNTVLLTVPLASGRDQHRSMGEVRVFNDTFWQVQHWRTLVSAYRRSPFFEHYEHTLQSLFEVEFDLLADFNRESVLWVRTQLNMKFQIWEATSYASEYPGFTDLRKPDQPAVEPPRYYQVFEDRHGFIPNLSILDLLFSEGPGAVDRLKT